MITANRLREVIAYDPSTGVFTWLVSRGKAKKGYEAGRLDAKGYRTISIDGKLYLAHRLAWFYATGEWPEDQIDHVNGNNKDNAFNNLRQATKSQNQHNRGKQSNNTSGCKGVWWWKERKKWRADIYLHGVKHYVGVFADKEQAHDAYRKAASKLHGKFARAS